MVSADSKNEFSSILWSEAFPFLTLAMVIQMYTFDKFIDQGQCKVFDHVQIKLTRESYEEI